MIEATFQAEVPKAINAEFEAIIPREKAFDIVNKDIHIDTNGKYEVKADAGTAMTQVNVEVDTERIDLCEEKDVNFYDYDGVRLYSYWWDEAEKLTELPVPQREHKGLVFDSWNYTLEDILEQGNYADVGALYVTDNGRTRIKVKPINGKATIFYNQSVSNGVKVYWGDGKEETQWGIGIIELTHEYENNVIKDVELEILDGTLSFGDSTYYTYNYNIVEINLGVGDIVLNAYSFYYCCAIERVSLNSHITSIGGRLVASIYYLSFPNSITYNAYAVINETKINRVSIPLDITNFTYMFRTPNKEMLEYIVIHSRVIELQNVNASVNYKFNTLKLKVAKNNPNFYSGVGALVTKSTNNVEIGDITGVINKNATSISSYSYINTNVDYIIIPDGVENLPYATFQQSRLRNITLGSNISAISNVFPNYVLQIIDASRCKVVPTMSSNFVPTVAIIVPNGMLDAFKTATNWSSSANIIIEEKDSLYILDSVDCDFTDVTNSTERGYCIYTAKIGEEQSFTKTTAATFVNAIIDVNNEDVLRISGWGGTSPRLAAFLDENNIVMWSTTPTAKGRDMLIKIPQGCKKILINSNIEKMFWGLKIELGKYKQL